MPLPIEDYALIGNTHTAALVGRDGSIDWFCAPRFDSAALFAALLGDVDNGRWLVAPAEDARAVRRRYRQDTLILETEFETANGAVAVIDFMPHPADDDRIDVVRLVRGLTGSVAMRTELVFRFDYGQTIPWVRQCGYGIRAVAGAHALRLWTPVALRGEDFRSRGDFRVEAGETVGFVLAWHPSHKPAPLALDPLALEKETERQWRDWTGRCRFQGPWREPVMRSLITLKALTYRPTGAIAAAPTTSLPEQLGGRRNWDYRYCWIRDTTFTLYALLICGYHEEARAWREWLLRAAAGQPQQLQIMYGLCGERLLSETTLDHLAGYADSAPVRVGNAAHRQFQLDVYGELMDAFHVARARGIEPEDDAWRVQRVVLDFLEDGWRQADEGLWEVRGERRCFTHSKVMTWVAFDRAVKAVERSGLEGPVERWRKLREIVHADVCEHGFDSERGAFVQAYGAKQLDASLLMMPLVGFLPAEDPRVVGTVEAIRRELTVDGLVLRYAHQSAVDGLPQGEGAFLTCSFWLADCLALMDRREEACELFERLLTLTNDVGLLAEEYDPRDRRMLGNFPQALSHVALVNTANNLVGTGPCTPKRPAAD